jgi:hypothetical protein
MIYRGPGILAPTPPPAPVFRLQILFFSLPACRRSSLLTEDSGEEVGKETNHTTAGKPGPLQTIRYSLYFCVSVSSKLAWGKSFYDSLFVTSLASSVCLFVPFPFILFQSLLPTLSYSCKIKVVFKTLPLMKHEKEAKTTLFAVVGISLLSNRC